MKHQIKHKHTGSVLFECELPDDTPAVLIDRHALEKATASGANLAGAYLTRADLDGANLDGAMLVGKRPIFQIGPIGSRCSYFTAYLTTEGVKLRTGCFFGTFEEFTEKLSKEHGDNDHAKEYQAALLMIKSHADLWMPEVKATGEA